MAYEVVHKFIETDRLCLRQWTNNDIEPFIQMNLDPVVMQFFPNLLNRNLSINLIKNFQIEINQKGYGFWAVEIKRDRTFVGFIGLASTTFESFFTPCLEIGWRLKKEAWGNGYATEGATACLEYAIRNLEVDAIYSFTSVLNKKSEQVMQRIGMKKIGEFNHPRLQPDNRLCRHLLYKFMTEN